MALSVVFIRDSRGRVHFIDEPTNDVDPVRRRYLWSEIKKLTRQGKAVILVTHNVVNFGGSVID